jgi:hypothetical protein
VGARNTNDAIGARRRCAMGNRRWIERRIDSTDDGADPVRSLPAVHGACSGDGARRCGPAGTGQPGQASRMEALGRGGPRLRARQGRRAGRSSSA